MALPEPPSALDYFLGFSFVRLKSLSTFTLLLFLLCSTTAVSQSIIETLPGYPGPLPFKLETGYIGVREDDAQLFYYFIESEGDPLKDPLVLWLTGGPGCSGVFPLFYEIGPLNFDLEVSDPSFVLNPYSWTKVASIIFIDSPPGTGFSYKTNSKKYHNTDTKVVEQLYHFLQKWLLKHPNFTKNRLYIAGDSYGGFWVPMVVWRISKGNEAGDEPHMAVEGYSIGNPITDSFIDRNARVEYAHRLGLISDEYYEMAMTSCEGNYVNPDSENAACLHALQLFKECTLNISVECVVEPCYPMPIEPEEPGFARRFLGDESMRISLPVKIDLNKCREIFRRHSPIWANDPTVQEALQVRKGTLQMWKRCNKSHYEFNLKSAIPYHQLLSKESYQALVYSGDHDLSVPYIGTLEWIRQLNLTLIDNWRPWFVQDMVAESLHQVAGYTERYINMESGYNLTFATLKGAGHTAAEYKHRESFEMFQRFISHKPL